MKLTIKTLALIIPLLLFNACKKDDETISEPENSSINKIMPLGASRVEGARPEYESFRYELWKQLKKNDWTFDFIGTQSDDTYYPVFETNNFDKDHEGRGGWTSEDILNGLDGWLNQTGPADIVLLSSPGGNDALQGLPFSNAVANINSIIDIIQADNPNVTIIIEQMASGRSDIMTPELTEFFEKMQLEVLNIAENQTTEISQIIVVDMFTGFNDSLLADDVHYNNEGAKFVANRYYNTLKTLLK